MPTKVADPQGIPLGRLKKDYGSLQDGRDAMDWNDVRFFLALARCGSVRAAGAALAVSHSTVARRVEALEAQLSARLFDRNRDGYTLTLAGEQMLPAAMRVEEEMAALERALVGKDESLSGPISITCCDHFVSKLLLKELRPFCARYPDIELRVIADTRPFDLSKREADIALRTLRVGSQPPQHLIGTRLAPVILANYVSQEHADQLDPQNEATRWLSFEPRKMHVSMIAESSYPDCAPWGMFSSLELIVQAAREGLGIAMLPMYAGGQSSSLVHLADEDRRHVADLWLLSHPDLRNNARLRAARAAVIAGIERHRHLFGGVDGTRDGPSQT